MAGGSDVSNGSSPINHSRPKDGYAAGPPWIFKGRALYQLNLVKADVARRVVPPELKLVEVFGYTLGGVYYAQYDSSPAGKFDELLPSPQSATHTAPLNSTPSSPSTPPLNDPSASSSSSPSSSSSSSSSSHAPAKAPLQLLSRFVNPWGKGEAQGVGGSREGGFLQVTVCDGGRGGGGGGRGGRAKEGKGEDGGSVRDGEPMFELHMKAPSLKAYALAQPSSTHSSSQQPAHSALPNPPCPIYLAHSSLPHPTTPVPPCLASPFWSTQPLSPVAAQRLSLLSQSRLHVTPGRTEAQPALLKYSCDLSCRVSLMPPATTRISPAYRQTSPASVAATLSESVTSPKELIAGKKSQDVVLEVLSGRPLIAMCFEGMEMRVEAPTRVVLPAMTLPKEDKAPMAACASTLHSSAALVAVQSVSLSSSQRLASTSSLSVTWRNVRQTSSPSHGRQQRFAVRAAAAEEASKKASGDDSGSGSDSEVDDRIIPYCDIAKKKQRTLGEMEQEFLLALQAYYIGQDPIMSNEEFDLLKEELLWEGSQVVVLSKDEQKFMEASLAYQAGKPFMNDREYDALKQTLKAKGSKVAIEGPRCSLRTRKAYSDSMVDYLRMTALNLPAAILALLVVFFFDDISGFEITYLLEVFI
ncbi:unnamed protein product [Closterium sp. NIES-54]